jgi:NAD-dependent deacetylase
VDCDGIFEFQGDIDPDKIPQCGLCGGKIRPDVVWFGEMLDPEIINTAFAQSEQADVFFSVGTSAIVHPAATLPVVAKNHGATLVEINVEETPLTKLADFHFNLKSGEILPKLVAQLKERQSLAGFSELA